MAQKLIDAILTNVVDPLVLLMFVVAVAVFLWGLAQFIWNTSDQTARDKGKDHMIWGIVGLFIMASVQGIIAIIENTIGA